MNLNGRKFHLANDGERMNGSGNEFNPNREIRKLVDLFKSNEVMRTNSNRLPFKCRGIFTLHNHTHSRIFCSTLALFLATSIRSAKGANLPTKSFNRCYLGLVTTTAFE